jgi:hypothetical protein
MKYSNNVAMRTGTPLKIGIRRRKRFEKMTPINRQALTTPITISKE